jgi:hypothetical protein
LPVAARISSKYREMLMKSMSHNICLSWWVFSQSQRFISPSFDGTNKILS